MTIKINTLEYIHQLLKEAEAKTSADCEAAQRLQDEYMEKGMEQELIKFQKETMEQLMEKILRLHTLSKILKERIGK